MSRMVMHTPLAIQQKIITIRDVQVMIDSDLANYYGVSTKALNQAVKRNKERFPEEFMFRLSKAERDEVVTNCDHLRNLKFSPAMPYAFTEQGVALLADLGKKWFAFSKFNIDAVKLLQKLDEKSNYLN